MSKHSRFGSSTTSQQRTASELRAVVFDPETLRAVIRHGWYPTADMSGGGVAYLAGELDDPDEERVASAHQVFINKFREDADTIEQRLAAQFRIVRRSSLMRSLLTARTSSACPFPSFSLRQMALRGIVSAGHYSAARRYKRPRV